ncbi:putative quinol monooxygenase [Nocardia africana]|uniref:Antibiotic biosynthesis monooxygenase n=1 Tax=Nocardia africana TaxID=134964 RepID=A0A378WNW2_9NOCA|nr:antibiotic biosynthesis monooxygenase family protein [Nocardia africana]MCC3314848.1 antibiotic biosynthesis monooxygenase [Nocardia africana]SUA42869.1 Antibiotic biosynthesis monooxygenase [Nocardia africana]
MDATPRQLIVTGYLRVDPADRDRYLATCVEVVNTARQTPGCLDFALSADLVDTGRINILERWSDRAALNAFRGAGVPDEQAAMIREAQVSEFTAGDETLLR